MEKDMKNSASITVYGTRWCGHCNRSRQVLEDLDVDYTWVDIDADPEAEKIVLQANRGMRSVPTIVFPDGSVLVEPSNRELEERSEQFKKK